jgi:riboflavin biosynthesis pyrimidine reductase
MVPYKDLTFPSPPDDRPYTYIDMVATIDGKILSGKRNEHVIDLGSEIDHQAMKLIASTAEAVLVGAATLRTTLSSWNPPAAYRIVVSRSGDLPFDSQFFAGGQAIVACPNGSGFAVPQNVERLEVGQERVDLPALFLNLRSRGIMRMLVLGGSELNAQALASSLVDELFLTIAPKVKLGRDVPTYADGVELPRERLQRYQVVEHHVIGDEIFLRYRRLLEE